MKKFSERKYYGKEKWIALKRLAIKRQLYICYNISSDDIINIKYDLSALRKYRKKIQGEAVTS